MNNNKLVLPISIMLGCVILGGFYYATQINKQQSIEKQQKFEIEEKRKVQIDELEKDCKESGEKMYESEKKEASGSTWSVIEPQYKYNSSIHKCLYSGGVSDGNYWTRYVKDTMTNENIIATYNPDTTKEDEFVSRSIENYWKEHEILFGK